MRFTKVPQLLFKYSWNSVYFYAVSTFASSHSPFPPESSHKCYFLDGSFDPAGGPCYDNVGAAMCCYDGEQCDDGSTLCLANPNGPVGTLDHGASIWRRSCTDFTWQDPACFAIAFRSGYKSVQLTNCSDGTFCPRAKELVNETCCDDHQGEFAVLGHARIDESAVSSIRAATTTLGAQSRSGVTTNQDSHSPSSTTSSIRTTIVASGRVAETALTTMSVSNSVSTSKTLSTSSSATSSPSTPALGQSAKIGIGVGAAAFGIIVVTSLGYVAFRRHKSLQRKSQGLGKMIECPGGLEIQNVNTEGRHVHELEARERPQELHTLQNSHEVEGRVSDLRAGK